MPLKHDSDATTGTKLLRLFQRLMLDGKRHYLRQLADWLNCSPQTIIRLTREIEGVIGTQLVTGIEGRKRWYQICPRTRNTLGLDFEELRYLRICRDLAEPYLPNQVKRRVDDSIFRFSLLLSESHGANDAFDSTKFAFFSKGHIDYTPHFGHIDTLLQALTTRRVCTILYKGAGKTEAKEYAFAVRRMVSMNNALYILGAELTDDLTSIARTLSFAVHRIVDVKITTTPIRVKIPDVDPEAFGLPWHAPRTFSIKFAPGKATDYVRERIWAHSQKIEDCADGGIVLTLTTHSEPELRAWVRSFGDTAAFVENTSHIDEKSDDTQQKT